MSRSAQSFLLVAVLAATGLGFASLYSLRIEKGDVFPPYSSLRADPLGTRALYESLEDLPNLRVARRFQPMESLPSAPPRTLIIAGLSPSDWRGVTSREFAAIDGAVRGGSRLVLALRADFADPKVGGLPDDEDDDDDPPVKAERPNPQKGDPAPRPAAIPPRGPRRELEVDPAGGNDRAADLKRLWGITLLKLGRVNYDKGAVLDPAGPRDLPRKLRWKSDSYFGVETGAPWEVVYRALGKPVVLESRYGRGSIVVMGDAYLLSNEGLLNDRSPRLLSWIIGPDTRVEFDESHLGVLEDVGMAALARRYGLAYAAGTLLLLATLFIWRRSALFVPPPHEADAGELDCSPTAALEALLLRSVPPAELMGACVAEWRASARPADLARLDCARLSPSPGGVPEAYNAAVRAMKRR